MDKVQILTCCKRCNGAAYIPVGEEVGYTGERYIRHEPCPVCEGSGISPHWISLVEFVEMLNEILQADQLSPDYREMASMLPNSQYADSRDSTGI